MEKKVINTLLIEDNPDDTDMIRRYLSTPGRVRYNVINVDKFSDGLRSLNLTLLDIILLDLVLPDAPSGIETFETVYRKAPHIPIIVLTGNEDDELAVEAVQKGAQDYLVKGIVSGSLLSRAIRYAIERKKLLTQLENSMKEIKLLREFLPICMHCKKIRDDAGYWTQVEVYISKHSNAEFSHGLCPDCAQKVYPDIFPGTDRQEEHREATIVTKGQNCRGKKRRSSRTG